jgi:hypothetical protein
VRLRCPIHPDQCLDPMWDKDADPQVAWRCDKCRRLYAIPRPGVFQVIKWPERKWFYHTRGIGRVQ